MGQLRSDRREPTGRGPAKPTRITGVVLAAGAGTRLGALGTRYSKPMVPIAGRPLIAWVAGRLQAAGVERLVVVGHASDTRLREYLRETQGEVELVIQSERRGIAAALCLVLPAVIEETGYLACACDSLCDPDDIAQLIACGRTHPNTAVVGILEMGRAATASRSAVLLDGDRVMQILEKPAPGSTASGNVALPVYWLPSTMRTYVERVCPVGKERYISTALNDFIAAGGAVLAVRMRERVEVTTAADVARAETVLRSTRGVST